MNKIVLLGQIEKGELKLNDLYLSHQLQKMGDGKIRMIVEKQKNYKSGKQLRYYFGGILRPIAEDVGESTDNLHEVMKRLYLPKKFVKYRGRDIAMPGSTRGATVGEMAGLILGATTEAADLGIIIESPDEWVKKNI